MMISAGKKKNQKKKRKFLTSASQAAFRGPVRIYAGHYNQPHP